MFFDDRLATVLRQNTQSDALRRTQFRQLLDLLGAQASGARKATRDPGLVAAAWMRMNKLAEVIPARDRARLIKEPSWQLRNPELAAHLADFEPEVASAALSRAELSDDDWAALIPRLPVRARGFLRLRNDMGTEVESLLERLGVHDRGLPHPDAETAAEQMETAAQNSERSTALGDPLDALPGSDIPAEDLPPADKVGAPLEPLSLGADEEADDIPAPIRPIFFPKDRSEQAEETAEDDAPQEDGDLKEPDGEDPDEEAFDQAGPDIPSIVSNDFAEDSARSEPYIPEPFTLEELREIAEEPLGSEIAPVDPEDESMDADDIAPEPTQPPVSPPPRPQSTSNDDQSEERSEISAIVDRIAAFTRSREEAAEAADNDLTPYEDSDALMPRLPLGEEDRAHTRLIRGFGFAADAAGRIEWAEGEAAPMIVGTRLIARSILQMIGETDALTLAFNHRQPMKSAPFAVTGAPAIAGDWVVDAAPRFSAIGGFSGYVGRMRRPLEMAAPTQDPVQRQADRIRQLLHELRTPVTAVQGYSEVIQQQLFGSAPHEYRALAAAIASDAARILSGFEELDRLAKLESGAIEVEDGATDLTALIKRIIQQLAQVLDARMAGLELLEKDESPLSVALDVDSAESLLWRVLATLGGGCGAGENLQAKLKLEGGLVHLKCDLPMQLLGEDDLFAADARPISTTINPGLFGAGFALRLARAEARAAGGDLLRKKDTLLLTLPNAQPQTVVGASPLETETVAKGPN